MKKAKQFFKAKLWLVWSLLLFGSIALNAQSNEVCISEGFELVQGGTSCSGVNTGELRQNSGTPCTGKGTTLTLEDGLVWTATADGALTYYTDAGNIHGGSKGLFIRRTFGLIFPTLDKPQTLNFWAKSGGTTASDRGFKVTVNGADVSMYINGASTAATTTASGYITVGSWSKITVPINSSANGVVIRIMTGGSSESDVYIDDIEVTCPPSCTTPATASLANAGPVNKYTNDINFTNALTTDNTSPKVWTSSNTAVASVNASTGEVTIGGAGTTTIRVTQVANGTICDVDKSYVLNVTEPPCTAGTNLGVSATLTPSNATENGFRATWTAVTDAVKYTLKVYQGAGTTPVQTQTVANTVTSVVITGLSTSTTYSFTVQAIGDYTTVCTGLESSKSTAITTKVPPSPMDCGSSMIPLYSTDFSNWETASGGSQNNYTTLTQGDGAGFQVEGSISVNSGETGLRTGSSGRRVIFPPFNFIAGGTVTIFVDNVGTTGRTMSLSNGATPASITATVGYHTFTLPASVTGEQSLTLTLSNSGFRIRGISICSGVGTDTYLTCNNYKDPQTNPTADGHQLSGDLNGAAYSGTAVNAIPNIKLWNCTNPVSIEIKGTDANRFSFSNSSNVLTATVSNIDATAGADIPTIYFSPTSTIGISRAYLEITACGKTYQISLSGASPRDPYLIADTTPLVFDTNLIAISPSQSVTIGGINLTTGVTLTVTGEGAERYILSTTNISVADLLSGFPLSIAYKGNIVSGTQNAELVITSTGASNSPVRIPLVGKTADPSSGSGGSDINLDPSLSTTQIQPCN